MYKCKVFIFQGIKTCAMTSPVNVDGLCCKTVPIETEYHVVCDSPDLVAGTGMSGAVVRCFRIRDGWSFALKFLPFTTQSVKEICAWRACMPHPNIVPLLDVFDSGDLPEGHHLLGATMTDARGERIVQRQPGRYFLCVMEDMLGGELFDLITNCELDEDTIALILSQALQALKHIHARGYVHGDIKLENLLLRHPAGLCIEVCVGDFGFARAISAEPTPRGRNYTRSYIAPETIESFDAHSRVGTFLPVGPSCDVWALGVVAYMLLTRMTPFSPRIGEDGWSDDRCITHFLRSTICDGCYPTFPLQRVSPAARDFVDALLVPMWDVRVSCEVALTHPWVCPANTVIAAPVEADPTDHSLRSCVLETQPASLSVGEYGLAQMILV